MPTERIAVEEILGEQPKVVQMTPMEPKKPSRTPEQVDEENARIAIAFRVAAKILAIRLFLFLSLLGSFVLAIMADESQSQQSAYVLLMFAFVTTLPLTILELRSHRGV